MFRHTILLLLISQSQFKWSTCEGAISSILFPFNTVIDQNSENKNQERNLSLRNRYQPSYSSTNTEYRQNPNLLNKLTTQLTSDKQNSKNSADRSIVVVPDLYCEKDEWMCNDNLRCISKAFLCDTIQHCIDSSDEIGCIGNCRGNEFKCANHKCIDERFICDTYDDCGDWSDEMNCIGTGKKMPNLTGNLKLDLDSFESIENQNLFFEPPKQLNSENPNHPNKHPDTFNSQLNKQQSSSQTINNNQVNQINQQSSQLNNQQLTSTTVRPQTNAPQSNQNKDELNNKKESINKFDSAPYIKIFPLTPLLPLNNTENSTTNRVAFNNYAILTNKLNSTDQNDKNLIESLGFGQLNNRSIESSSPSKKEMEASSNKTVKLSQNKVPELNNQTNLNNIQPDKMQNGSIENGKNSSQINKSSQKLKNLQTNKVQSTNLQSKNEQFGSKQDVKAQNGSAQALSGKELANENKNSPNNLKNLNEKSKASDQNIKSSNPNLIKENKIQSEKINHTIAIDVSRSNPGGQRLAFSINLPKATEPTKLKSESNNRKNKTKDSKDEKKLNCKRILNDKSSHNKTTIEACKHCSYGLFRCSMGKCVITSFECGMNATNSTRGRRIAVNVNDFLQFV